MILINHPTFPQCMGLHYLQVNNMGKETQKVQTSGVPFCLDNSCRECHQTRELLVHCRHESPFANRPRCCCRRKGQRCTAQHPHNTVSAAGWKNTFPGGCLGYELSSFLIPCLLRCCGQDLSDQSIAHNTGLWAARATLLLSIKFRQEQDVCLKAS